MTMPRWTLPTVSIIAAIAVAVGGALIGSNFASHDTNLVSTGSQTVAVIAPVATGSAPDEGASTGPGDAIRVSDSIAEREVHRPAADPRAIDPSLQHIIDELADAPDPSVRLMTLDEETDGTDSSVADDPCAPRDGTDPTDCPEGLHSTILSIIALRDFFQSGQAFPPTTEEYRAHGNPLGGVLWCDGLTSSATSVPIGILATAPGSFSVRYWPTSHPDLATTNSGISTSPEDRQNFEDAVASATTVSEVPLLRQCGTLTGLEPNTAYTAVVSGLDTRSRVSPPSTFHFNSSGAPVHPSAQIVTIGENLVFVSALHPYDQIVGIRATVVESGAVPGCGGIDDGRWLPSLTETDVAVSSEDVDAVNAPADYNNKHVLTFAVPEGSTILVCARWYSAGTAPSWQRVNPNYESSAILQSPDRLDPQLNVTRVMPFAPGLSRIAFQVANSGGVVCGSGLWDPSIIGYGTLPILVCDSIGNSGGATLDYRGFLSDRGSSGDLVLRTTSTFTNNSTVDTDVLIPSVDGGCRGVCAIPENAWYEVALGSVDRPTGLCGSSFGDCSPPTRSISAGTIQVEVSWAQGAHNGRAEWNVTPASDLAPDYVSPAEAQFDLNQRWTFDEPGYPPGYGYIAPNTFVTGRYTLTVDRPVDYTVRFTDGPPGIASGRCDVPGQPLEVSGHTDHTTSIQMPGACLGTSYYAEIVLVDAEGNRAAWGFVDRSHYWGSASLISVPWARAEIHFDVLAQSFMRSATTDFNLAIGHTTVTTEDTRSGRCTSDGIVVSQGVMDVDLSAMVYVRLELRIRAADHWEPDDCRGFTFDNSELKVIEAHIPIADLYRLDGATITAPDAYGARITLHAYRP